jgi:phosphoglycerate dehydrogenase-like enzyme
MAKVLFYAPSYDRIRTAIERIERIEPMLMQADGTILFFGKPISDENANPEVAWTNNDLYAGPLRPYMVTLLKSKNLRWVQSGAAGFDNPVFGQLVKKGARLTNNHSMSIGIAEYVLANVLDHFQRGPERRQAQREGKWARLPYREIIGSRWLVLGFGAIGQEVARRAKAFGAHITGVRRNQEPHPLADAIIPLERVHELLPRSDVVVLSVPLSSRTENFVNETFLTAMKKGSTLVNVGRGGLVDEDSLLAALDRGIPAHAILDVFKTEPLPADSKFWHHPRVRLSGHASAIGSGLSDRTDALFVENLGRYMRGDPLLNQVAASEVVS